MRRTRSTSIGALALLLGSALPAAWGQGQAGIAWEGDYEAALERAQKEKKPILVSFSMDNEVANDETVRDHYTDPRVVALTRKMVCLVGHIGDHAAPGEPCPKFPAITCEQHRAVEMKLRARYIEGEWVRAPQHVFCNPQGAELFRRVYYISKDQLRRAMSVAIAGLAEDPETAELAATERSRVDRLLQDIESKNLEVRNAAFQELATADDPRAIPALLDKAKPANDESVRYSAIHALGQRGNHAAVKPLLGFLGDRNSKISIYALYALEKIELPDPADELLALLKRERNGRIRAHAVRALAKSLPESPEVRNAVLAALKGADTQLEGAALVALFSLKPDPKIASAVKPLLTSKNQNTRALAYWVFGKQRDPSLVPLLQKACAEDKSPESAEVAMKAAAYCRGEEVPGYEYLSGRFFWDEDVWEVSSWGGRKEGGSVPPPR